MPSSCLQVWVVLEMNQIGCTRVDKVYNQHTDAITNGLIYPNNICQEQKIGRYTMDLILIIAVIAFIYLWKKKKQRPAFPSQNPPFINAAMVSRSQTHPDRIQSYPNRQVGVDPLHYKHFLAVCKTNSIHFVSNLTDGLSARSMY